MKMPSATTQPPFTMRTDFMSTLLSTSIIFKARRRSRTIILLSLTFTCTSILWRVNRFWRLTKRTTVWTQSKCSTKNLFAGFMALNSPRTRPCSSNSRTKATKLWSTDFSTARSWLTPSLGGSVKRPIQMNSAKSIESCRLPHRASSYCSFCQKLNVRSSKH